MPYIKKERRKALEHIINELFEDLNSMGLNKGDLNYCITMLIKKWVETKGLSYDTLSDITGVLNDVKTEFERKVVAQYEDRKIQENGEIYNDLFVDKK
jgi:hypothetical protein